MKVNNNTIIIPTATHIMLPPSRSEHLDRDSPKPLGASICQVAPPPLEMQFQHFSFMEEKNFHISWMFVMWTGCRTEREQHNGMIVTERCMQIVIEVRNKSAYPQSSKFATRLSSLTPSNLDCFEIQSSLV